jgi:hypothetical protein
MIIATDDGKLNEDKLNISNAKTRLTASFLPTTVSRVSTMKRVACE